MLTQKLDEQQPTQELQVFSFIQTSCTSHGSGKPRQYSSRPVKEPLLLEKRVRDALRHSPLSRNTAALSNSNTAALPRAETNASSGKQRTNASSNWTEGRAIQLTRCPRAPMSSGTSCGYSSALRASPGHSSVSRSSQRGMLPSALLKRSAAGKTPSLGGWSPRASRPRAPQKV